MKRLFLRLFMLLAALVGVSACSPHPETAEVSGSVKTRVAWPQKDGSYALQIVELTGLNSLYDLGGQFAKFFLSPRILEGRLDGSTPKTRFIKSGDLYIAGNELSLHLATVYAHMQNFAALDRELGVGDVNHWPRDIGVRVRFQNGLNNNAFYDGDTDSMLLVPYVGKELPIPVNAGILAHEHFHSLFYKIVMSPLQTQSKWSRLVGLQGSVHSQDQFYDIFDLPKKPERAEQVTSKENTYYHLLLMRGMNEGLADFWGWIYTGSTSFIENSLPTEKSRDMNVNAEDRVGAFTFDSSLDLRARIRNWSSDDRRLMNNITSYAYTIGTVYSRTFKAYADVLADSRQLDIEVARKEVAKVILKTLVNFKEDLLRQGSKEFYEPSSFVASFAKNTSLKKGECQFLVEALKINRKDTGIEFSCEPVAAEAGSEVSQWEIIKKEPPAPIVKASESGKKVELPVKPGVVFER